LIIKSWGTIPGLVLAVIKEQKAISYYFVTVDLQPLVSFSINFISIVPMAVFVLSLAPVLQPVQILLQGNRSFQGCSYKTELLVAGMQDFDYNQPASDLSFFQNIDFISIHIIF